MGGEWRAAEALATWLIITAAAASSERLEAGGIGWGPMGDGQVSDSWRLLQQIAISRDAPEGSVKFKYDK